jgi:hypothetical protein
LQVRRTDKLLIEAEYHPLEKYMKYIDEYFEILELQKGQKLAQKIVFLATDEAEVYREAREKYS